MARTARISFISDAIIEELVDRTGKSKIEIMEEALKSYRFRERMRLFNQAYAKLKENEKGWNEELAERREWEGTIMDGLENE